MIMNIVFITMMFGSGLPILFPIALVSFIVIYMLEKYMLYYVYTLPTKYDGQLLTSVLRYSKTAAIVFLVMSFW
jgi:hypothetical protein